MKLTITLTNVKLAAFIGDMDGSPDTLHATLDCTTLKVEVESSDALEQAELMERMDQLGITSFSTERRTGAPSN